MQFTNFRDVDIAKVVFTEPKIIEVKEKDLKYAAIDLKYNFGTVDKPVLKSFLLEYPECEAPFGINERVNDQGRVKYSLQVIPIDADEAEELHQFYMAL